MKYKKVVMNNVRLNYEQQEFIDEVISGRNVFLTGKAGTGKSFVVRHAIEKLKEAGKKVIAVAPTGIAANNIDGQTIHSLFALQPFGVLSFDVCNFLKQASRTVLEKADVIFIDEVSMLRPDVLDGMHWTMKKNGLIGLDKKQVVFVGDLKQLPPVLDDNTRSVLYQNYQSESFEASMIFQKMLVKIVELTDVVRQSDPEFLAALNVVRDGGKDPYFRQFLHNDPIGVVLAPHNTTVEAYNAAGLAAQQGKLYQFQASLEGSAKPEDFPLENNIKVKDGCKIMYLVNSQNNPLRNGTIGVFRVIEGKFFIKVHGVDYALEPVTMTKKTYVYDKVSDALELKELGKITQFPFRLAYAISIHKAQGLTFEEVTVDLSRPCFQKGQLYVALSRVKTPKGLRIIVEKSQKSSGIGSG